MPIRPNTLVVSRRRFIFGLGGLAAALATPGVASAATPIAVVVPPHPAVKPPVAPPPPPMPERWLQNHRATSVWAEAEGSNVVAEAPQWSYFKIVGPQLKARIPVQDPRLGPTRVWIEAGAVGPSGPPPPPAPKPAVVEPFWVAPFKDVPLLLDPQPDGLPATTLAQFAPLKVIGPARGSYYPVEEPFAKLAGWVDAGALGKVGQPDAVPATRWWGAVVVDEARGRAEPTSSAPIVATYKKGQVLGFVGWSEGEQVAWDDPAWGQVADGLYVYGRLTRPLPVEAPPPPRIDSIPAGRWIGINRTLQLVVAYEGDKPLFWARTSTGRPGWETPLGSFSVIRRVAKETMDSATLIGRDAERAKYKIEDVKYTQYFTNDGNAIHENWWKDPDTFGLPSSHGCAGLPTADAQKFWNFGEYGMPVIVHL